MRKDGRSNSELRDVKITKDYIKNADGSVLIEMGDTKVICTATIDDNVPSFKKILEKVGLLQNIQCYLELLK